MGGGGAGNQAPNQSGEDGLGGILVEVVVVQVHITQYPTETVDLDLYHSISAQ